MLPSITLHSSQWGKHNRIHLRRWCLRLYFKIFNNLSNRSSWIKSMAKSRSEARFKPMQQRPMGSACWPWRLQCADGNVNSCTRRCWGRLVGLGMDGIAYRSRLVTASPFLLKCSQEEAFRSAQRRQLSCLTRQTTILISLQSKQTNCTIRREHVLTLWTRALRATQSRTT